ncbi:MAG: uroporphyrinogen decarboxylase family protein [Candidatus Latescibacterota bacterium]
MKKLLLNCTREAYHAGRRVVVPLMGFPGLSMTGSSIKLAQQNYGEHYKAIKALVDTFHPDLVFPLMDLSVEANALGRYTVFPKDDSATVPKDAFDEDDINRWRLINISYDSRLMGYVEVQKLMSIGLPPSILRGAYVAGPYSLAALIMGADEAAVATLLSPDRLDVLCEFTTETIQQYTRLLIGAGAQVICILEPSAVMLGPEQFERFSSRYVGHISKSCQFSGVDIIYHICGNTMHLIDKMVEAGVNGISLDSPETGVDLPAVARRVPEDVAVIGNINPTATIFKGTPAEVEKEVTGLLKSMEFCPQFILSTGCDLPQDTPLGNIAAFMRTGRNSHILRSNIRK